MQHQQHCRLPAAENAISSSADRLFLTFCESHFCRYLERGFLHVAVLLSDGCKICRRKSETKAVTGRDLKHGNQFNRLIFNVSEESV